jgi:3-oxoacyl-[acyl-carrier-protein] synthase-1
MWPGLRPIAAVGHTTGSISTTFGKKVSVDGAQTGKTCSMTPVRFSAMACISALGRGLDATFEALSDRRTGLRPTDFPGMDPIGYLGRVEGIEHAVLPEPLSRFACRNNRLAYAALTSDSFSDAVDLARRRHGPRRVGVLIGTSTSGIEELEAAYRKRDSDHLPKALPFKETHDVYSPARMVKAMFQLEGPSLVISTACSSSANAIATAADWLEAGMVDAVVAGGADSLCLTTLRGFHALELLAPEPCQPCGADRKGISIGEAAAFVLLERHRPEIADAVGLLGYGCSNDAHHMSTPQPEGLGAKLAMTRALECARLAPAEIDYVNFHGTGTPFNDSVEDLAVYATLGERPPCSSTKGWTGHTLGTAGALEAIIACLSVRHGFLPGCINVQRLDPQLRTNVILENRSAPVRRVLSNSFGFGGNNCCLAIGMIN